MRAGVNLWETRLSKETQPGTNVKGRSKRECVETQLGMAGKTHGWMRSLRLHEGIGGRVQD